MRRAVMTAPYTIEWRELELPAPGADEVLVRVEQCGVCASELSLWTGKEPDQLPAQIGHEVAGVVEEVGSGVTSVAAGESVVVWAPECGGFAERILTPERWCVRVAPGLAFPAVAEPLACVVGAVELAAPALGDDVVIVGAGFMGNLLQLASALKGPRSVTVADMRPDALARAAELGATRVVDTRSESVAEAVLEVTDGRGADVAYEAIGVQAGLDMIGESTRMGGKLCVVGYHLGGPRAIPLGRWNYMAFQIVNAHFRDPATIVGHMRAGMRLVETGALDVAPLKSDVLALDDVAEAFACAAEKPESFVKSVVEIGR
jgi:L-iditol 2-dehydrogenase